jgi:hypothetical protein
VEDAGVNDGFGAAMAVTDVTLVDATSTASVIEVMAASTMCPALRDSRCEVLLRMRDRSARVEYSFRPARDKWYSPGPVFLPISAKRFLSGAPTS